MRGIRVSGDIAMWPEGQVLPRELGLEVLFAPHGEEILTPWRVAAWSEPGPQRRGGLGAPSSLRTDG
ncbi:hypothetical protein [Streptomyces sp. A1-5]|uniref:hypothetical protein n=1 Tax=Streptomyces sp. A1-5 TaxID=2738410 RepID=UPI001F3B3B11|nr:hypothetical protein [Streptomyces sp. A1-5]UJB40772.1 hypothetical protein HRD51_08015 [Streptomyces sp. A1-5]